jgi:dTDP-4-dehydrorhamnose reductase
VDKAETEREAAFRVNARGPKNLAEAAERHGARLVHFGSDYVFDGAKEDGLYEEGDPPRPLNQYGSSKRTGEQAVLDVLQGRALVLRLSWVFGEGKQNFVHKFLERVGRNLPLAVTYDEFSVPTWTGTIAEAALEAVEQGLTGLFHLTSTGYCSRFEWARLILKARGAERFIRPVSMDSLRLPARRPTFSAMSSALIARQLRMTIPPWEEAVSRFLEGRHDP